MVFGAWLAAAWTLESYRSATDAATLTGRLRANPGPA
jgi:hypothetical protein